MRAALLLLLTPVALAAGVGTAHSQISQHSIRLNFPTLSSQYLSVSNKTGLEGLSAITIEAWVYPTSYTNFPAIVGNNYAHSYWLGLTLTGNLSFYPNASGVAINSAGTIPLNTWTHVAGTYDAATGNAQLIVNGSVVLTVGGFTGSVGTDAGDLRIGADRFGGSPSYFWRGYLDEVRIWSVARTATDIAATMLDGVGNPALMASTAYSGLAACWDMEEPNPIYESVDDRAGGFFDKNDAFLVGSPAFSAQAPPVSFNRALQLDGSGAHAELYAGGSDFSRGLTLDAWICPAVLSGYQTIIGRNYADSFWLGLTPDGHVSFYPCGGYGRYVDSQFAVLPNCWTHVAASYADGLTRIYLNGRLDTHSTAITGPVGDNGLNAYVGADPEGGPAYPFTGMIDNARIFTGAISAVTLRDFMYLGFQESGDLLTGVTVPDELGVDCEMVSYTADALAHEVVTGAASRLVYSGAPLAEVNRSAITFYEFSGFNMADPGCPVTGDPRGLSWLSVGSDVFVQQTTIVGGLQVFFSGVARDLSQTRIQLRSPTGTWLTLMDAGSAQGREIHTVFDDGSFFTLATVGAPYDTGVRPLNPLSTFNGEAAYGLWRMVIDETDAANRVNMWDWGIRVNGVSVGIPAEETPLVLAIRLAGPAPVHGPAAFALDLPRDGRVLVELFDVQGRRQRTLANDILPAGRRQLTWDAGGLEPGIYVARLVLDGRQAKSIKVPVAR